MYLFLFLEVASVEVNTYFAPLVPPHEDFRELLPTGSPQDPFSLFLEFPLGHGVAHQLLLQLGEQEVSRGQVRWIGGMLEQFDVFFARDSWTPFAECTRALSHSGGTTPPPPFLASSSSNASGRSSGLQQ